MIFTNSLYNDYISGCSRDFLESAKIHPYTVFEYGMHVTGIMASDYYMREIYNSTVEYGNISSIPLPKVRPSGDLEVWNRINKTRSSIRHFDERKTMSLEDISSVLQQTLFITKPNLGKHDVNHRNIASPGGLYPVDLYYLNLKDIPGLKAGAYFYDIFDQSLKLLSDPLESKVFFNKVLEAFSVEEGVPVDIDFFNASGIVILSGTLNRTTFKYLDRGIKWIFTEAGAILNNLQLVATAHGHIGACPCAGFIDDDISSLLGFETANQLPIISIVIGRTKK